MENPDSRDMQSPVGTPFSLNFSVALKEENREPTARSKSHWKALSNVSFHVELVSSSIGSFSSELTAKSTFSIEPPGAETRNQGSINTGLKVEQQSPKESTPLRRLHTAPSSLLNATCGVEIPGFPMDEVEDESERKEAPRRHTLNNCDEGDLHLAADKLLSCDTSPTKLHSAAFQSSRTNVRKTKKPPPKPSFKQNSCVPNQQAERPNTSNSKATKFAGVSTQPRRGNPKNTPKEAEAETVIESNPSPPRFEKGGGPPARRSFFGNQGSGVNRTSAGDSKRESSIKRIMTSLLKCFCSDSKAEEQEAEIHSSRNTTE